VRRVLALWLWRAGAGLCGCLRSVEGVPAEDGGKGEERAVRDPSVPQGDVLHQHQVEQAGFDWVSAARDGVEGVGAGFTLEARVNRRATPLMSLDTIDFVIRPCAIIIATASDRSWRRLRAKQFTVKAEAFDIDSN
jgi:hypothetical protein